MAKTADRVKASELGEGDIAGWEWPKGSITPVKVVTVAGERVAVVHKHGRAEVFASSLRGPIVKAAKVAKPNAAKATEPAA